MVGKLLKPTSIGGSPWSIVGTIHCPNGGVHISCIDPRVNCYPSGIHTGKLPDEQDVSQVTMLHREEEVIRTARDEPSRASNVRKFRSGAIALSSSRAQQHWLLG